MSSPTSPTSRTSLTLRWVALVGTLASIATLEYLAGQAAGWGELRSAGVPLGIDAFVMAVLLAPRSSGFDRLAALGLMEFTVVVSAVAGHHERTADGKQPNVILGAVLATALVFALWRLDETIRADRAHTDVLAASQAALERAERAEALVRTLQRDLERARADLADLADLAAKPAPPAAAPAAPVETVKPTPAPTEKPKGCPTREAARQILLDLDLAGKLAETSNAELHRRHAGSDVWWGQRRAEYLAELAKFNTEAGAL